MTNTQYQGPKSIVLSKFKSKLPILIEKTADEVFYALFPFLRSSVFVSIYVNRLYIWYILYQVSCKLSGSCQFLLKEESFL